MSAHRDDWEHLRVCVISLAHVPDAEPVDRYCPGGPDSDFDYSTQSYTGYEPTSMRAIRARYDPYEQTRGRVEQLKSLGHNVDKVRHRVAQIVSKELTRASIRSNLSSWEGRS